MNSTSPLSLTSTHNSSQLVRIIQTSSRAFAKLWFSVSDADLCVFNRWWELIWYTDGRRCWIAALFNGIVAMWRSISQWIWISYPEHMNALTSVVNAGAASLPFPQPLTSSLFIEVRVVGAGLVSLQPLLLWPKSHLCHVSLKVKCSWCEPTPTLTAANPLSVHTHTRTHARTHAHTHARTHTNTHTLRGAGRYKVIPATSTPSTFPQEMSARDRCCWRRKLCSASFGMWNEGRKLSHCLLWGNTWGFC